MQSVILWFVDMITTLKKYKAELVLKAGLVFGTGFDKK